MNFEIPTQVRTYLTTLDAFIAQEIDPLVAADDNVRFFDHRREWARTDFENQGLPRADWSGLMASAVRLADQAGHYRYGLPTAFGGQAADNLSMAIVREHLAKKGLGLHYDQQSEHSIIANNPFAVMIRDYGSPEQKAELIPGLLDHSLKFAFGLTEPLHGSDATFMDATATPERRNGVDGWLLNGEKMWTSGMHEATHCAVFARSDGRAGDAKGITCFLVPKTDPGVQVQEYLWTFNMPTDHPRVAFRDIWVPAGSVLGEPGEGLSVAQAFVHENRIRQAAGSLGAAAYCVEESVKYARVRRPFGKPLSDNQAIQWPLVELATQIEMLRLLIWKTAWEMDRSTPLEIETVLSPKVSMCNYWANRLCCEAADRAMQVHGAIGYSRHKPFEHIYRHHRRYRITEGSEEIQMRKVAAHLFGYVGARKHELGELTWDDVDYRNS